MDIIDSHHHFWDPKRNYYPWLCDRPQVPFRYGDYAPICDRFMLDEYDIASHEWNIIASVTMEGEWDPTDPIGEALWMQELANETGRPSAHSAQIWLDQENLEKVLTTYDQLPLVRSVRHKPRSNRAPGGPPGGMTDMAFREGVKRVSDHGLLFELQTPWWHLLEAEELLNAAPELNIILNHAGLPSDRSGKGISQWKAAIKRFSEFPNTFVKISGLGLPNRPWKIEENIDIIHYCIDVFGSERAMFASNFPVDGLCGSFNDIFSGFLSAVKDRPPKECSRLFSGTAAAVYQLEESLMHVET